MTTATTAPTGHATFAEREDNFRSTGDTTRTIRTVADLAAVIADLDPDTPVTFDPVVRGAPGLSPEHHPHVVIVDTSASTCVRSTTEPHRFTAALELGARLVADPGAPIPYEAFPCNLMHRMAEAFDAGDVDDGLRAAADILLDVADQVVNEGAAWLPPISPNHGSFADVASSLRHISLELRTGIAASVSTEMADAERP
ncbi:hypothetical protein KIF24_24745 [Micromonospora sp. Llam7]|uniref:hypothetical protein n=1 Tax=Micromonospora tarapacensis TaxID=2835305 RepID=UPI001C82EB8D|nr:hypothetical protein [Micromonospora tarapacensis]MBX7268921.1 hypothetical protein [Micromonospora tarapacensis]